MTTAKIKTPEIFKPLWVSKARFKGSWGGRGGGKSHDRAQDLILKMLKEPGVRCACIREVQISIKDSVHQLMRDWIHRLGLSNEFIILEKEIRGINGSVCVFKGMKDQNAESIKSMEGIKYCWWEEAQTASDKSIRLLRPTIRTPGSEIWFTWNPRKKTDPVDKLLRQQNLDGNAIVVEAQYTDNPYFPEELEIERLIDLGAGDDDNYDHVWLGAYQSEADMQLISDKDVRRCQKIEPVADIQDPMILGVDVARFGDDKSVIYPRRGRDAKTMPTQVYSKMDTMQFAGKVAAAIDRYRPDGVFVDEGGIGGGVIDRLGQLGYEVIGINFGGTSDFKVDGSPKTANKRSEMWSNMREMLKSGMSIPEDDDLETELTGPLYTYDKDNAILLEKKADMKKRGMKSPDIADALALTYAYPVVSTSVEREIEEREDETNDDPFKWD